MTVTTWASATAIERWRSEFVFEGGPPEFMKKFSGKEDTNFLQQIDDLVGEKGKSIHIDLITALPSGGGIVGDGIRANNEVNIVVYEQEVTLDSLSKGTISKGPLHDQQHEYDFRKLSLRQLGEWFRVEKDIDLITVLSASPTRKLGADDGGTPRIDSATSKSQLADADKITVADIRLLKTLAEKPYDDDHPRIKPVMYKGESLYVLLISSECSYDLKADAEYQQLMRDAWWRGSKNPLFRDAQTVIDNVLVHKYEKIQTFDNGGGASVHGSLNLFLGAQAAVIANTKNNGRTTWHEELVDRGKQNAVWGTLIYEIAKCKFNSIDQSVIAYYAASTDLSG